MMTREELRAARESTAPINQRIYNLKDKVCESHLEALAIIGEKDKEIERLTKKVGSAKKYFKSILEAPNSRVVAEYAEEALAELEE